MDTSVRAAGRSSTGQGRAPRLRPLLLLAAPALLALASPAAPAHGGTYRSPADPGNGSPSPALPGASTSEWNDWWWSNRDRYLDLARRRRRARPVEATPTGGMGAMAGAEGAAAETDPAAGLASLRETLVLPAVTRALSDPDAEVRSAAAVALGKMGFERSFLDLQRALRDPHPDVRDGAILALGMLRDEFAAERLRAILHDPAERARTRGFAALALGILGGDGPAGTLLAFLAPEADAERVGGIQRTTDLMATAVIALGHTGSQRAAGDLRRLYASGRALETAPRCCAALSLGKLRDRESIPLLLKGIAHPEAFMRQSAAIALGVVGGPGDAAVVEALDRVVREDENMPARHFAAIALGRIGGDAARFALRRLLDDARGAERTYAALAIAMAGDKPSAPALRALLRGPGDADIHGAAATALGILGDAEALPLLRETAFGKGDSVVRGHCLEALGLLCDEDSAVELRRIAAEEPDPRLRLCAAVALGILQDPGAVEALGSLATKGSTIHLRAHSSYFLGVVGGAEAARILVRIVEDRQEEMIVRMHAVAGLGVLADRSPCPVLSGLGADANHLLAVDPLQEVSTFL
jgi:HEAT repeat protein